MIQFKSNSLTVFQSALYMTTTAVVQTSNSVILTDPNWLPSEIDEIKTYISKVIGEKQLYVIYTHSDFDHIIGAGAFPEAKVIATKEFNENPYKNRAIEAIKAFDQGYYINRNYETIYPTVDIIIEQDGYQLHIDEVTITFYKAPGHTNDGLFAVIEPYGIFLAGDYLSDMEFPFICSSYEDYMDTVTKAKQLLSMHSIRTLVPGHGTTTQDLQEITRRINDSKFYLDQLHKVDEGLEELLRVKYSFFEGMKESHTKNIEMARCKR